MNEARLHVLLERLSNVLREDLREVATRQGLALAQLEALHFLASANRFSDTLSALADYLGATKGTVSQTLSVLARKGLIERISDPEDARIQHCRLTPEGLGLARESLPAPVLRGLGGEDEAIETIEGMLREMLARRAGVAFGICRTCVHHEARPGGAWCRLLSTALSEEDAGKLCREHAPSGEAA